MAQLLVNSRDPRYTSLQHPPVSPTRRASPAPTPEARRPRGLHKPVRADEDPILGVRGSFPVASPDVIRYGGNTPCIEIETDDGTIVIDAGTGIRDLGKSLLERSVTRFDLLLSHAHWDHIQGSRTSNRSTVTTLPSPSMPSGIRNTRCRASLLGSSRSPSTLSLCRT